MYPLIAREQPPISRSLMLSSTVYSSIETVWGCGIFDTFPQWTGFALPIRILLPCNPSPWAVAMYVVKQYFNFPSHCLKAPLSVQ